MRTSTKYNCPQEDKALSVTEMLYWKRLLDQDEDKEFRKWSRLWDHKKRLLQPSNCLVQGHNDSWLFSTPAPTRSSSTPDVRLYRLPQMQANLVGDKKRQEKSARDVHKALQDQYNWENRDSTRNEIKKETNSTATEANLWTALLCANYYKSRSRLQMKAMKYW